MSLREEIGAPILVGTHHRAGTVWMADVFRGVCSTLDLRFFSARQDDVPRDFDVFVHEHSRFRFSDLPEHRGLHMIRDPRDVIVSGCFYHQTSAEEWLHERRPEYGGMTYQERLRGYSTFEDQLLFEMQEVGSHTLHEMLSWDYSKANFWEAKYEELIVDVELTLFRQVFEFLNFPHKVMPQCLKIVDQRSIWSATVFNRRHVRSGAAGQWKTYFNETHRRRFSELFGDALVQLGYESDDRWVMAEEP